MSEGCHISEQQFRESKNPDIRDNLVKNDFYTGGEERTQDPLSTLRRDFSTGKLKFNHRTPIVYNDEGVIISVSDSLFLGLVGKRQDEIDNVTLPNNVLLTFLSREFPGVMDDKSRYADVLAQGYSQGPRGYTTSPLFAQWTMSGFHISHPKHWTTDIYQVRKGGPVFQYIDTGTLEVRDTNDTSGDETKASTTIPGNAWIFELTKRPAATPVPAWKWVDTIVFHQRLFDLYMGVDLTATLKKGGIISWFKSGKQYEYRRPEDNFKFTLLHYESIETPPWVEYEERTKTLSQADDFEVALVMDDGSTQTVSSQQFTADIEKYLEGNNHYYVLPGSPEMTKSQVASIDHYTGNHTDTSLLEIEKDLESLLNDNVITPEHIDTSEPATSNSETEGVANTVTWNTLEIRHSPAWKKYVDQVYRRTFDFGSIEGPARFNIASLVGLKRTERSEQFAAFLGLPRRDENFVINSLQYTIGFGFILTPALNVVRFFVEFIPGLIEVAAERARIALMNYFDTLDNIQNKPWRYTAKFLIASSIAAVSLIEGMALLTHTLTRRATSPIVACREAWVAGRRIHPVLGYVFAGISVATSFGFAVLLATVAAPILFVKGVVVGVKALGNLPGLHTLGGYIATGLGKVFSGASLGISAIGTTLAIEFTIGTTLKAFFRKGYEKLKIKFNSTKPPSSGAEINMQATNNKTISSHKFVFSGMPTITRSMASNESKDSLSVALGASTATTIVDSRDQSTLASNYYTTPNANPTDAPFEGEGLEDFVFRTSLGVKNNIFNSSNANLSDLGIKIPERTPSPRPDSPKKKN